MLLEALRTAPGELDMNYKQLIDEMTLPQLWLSLHAEDPYRLQSGRVPEGH